MAVNREGYKQTKLGLIPEGWSIKSLGELGVFSKGKGIAKKDILEDNIDGLPCVRYAEIYTSYNYNTRKLKSKINKESAENSNPIEYGDILFAGSGETLEDIGKSIAYLGKNPAYAGGDISILKQHKQDPQYLGYLFNNDVVRNQLFKIGQGHSVVHIYSSGLKKVMVPLPPISEQQKIASILSTWDKAIAAQEKLIVEKRELKSGLIDKLIVTKKDKSNLVRLKDVCSKIQDGNYGAKYPKAHEFLENGVPFLTSKAIGSGGKIYHAKLNFISEKKHKELTKGHLKLNDVLFTNRGANVGAIAMVSQDIAHGNIGPQLTLLRTNDRIISEFLKYVMTSNVLRKQILQQDSGSAMNFFGIGDTSKFKIPLPSISEQNRVVTVLLAIDKELKILINGLILIKNQKQGLMQQLLTGEKRVKV